MYTHMISHMYHRYFSGNYTSTYIFENSMFFQSNPRCPLFFGSTSSISGGCCEQLGHWNSQLTDQDPYPGSPGGCRSSSVFVAVVKTGCVFVSSFRRQCRRRTNNNENNEQRWVTQKMSHVGQSSIETYCTLVYLHIVQMNLQLGYLYTLKNF